MHSQAAAAEALKQREKKRPEWPFSYLFRLITTPDAKPLMYFSNWNNEYAVTVDKMSNVWKYYSWIDTCMYEKIVT